MDVLALLRSKNKCLERFLEASQGFISREQNAPDLNALPELQQRRESAIKAIELYDRKIEEAAALLTEADRTEELSTAVKAELTRRDVLVEKILRVDLELISRIEDAKNSLLRDMANEKKSKDTLAKFKSTWVAPSGEGIDGTL
jgi:hypothetical protein